MGCYLAMLCTVLSVAVVIDAECHCNTTTACAVFPSTPCSQVGSQDRCEEGWFGPYCQKQNVALRRSSTQSSTYMECSKGTNNLNHSFTADYGVDGRTTNSLYDKPLSCTHTAAGDQHHTWTVYLNTSSTDRIQHIRLYLRTRHRHRYNGMEVLVGGQMCYNWSSTERPPPLANVTCRQPLAGNNVTIRVPDGSDIYLTLCEVQIFVCSDGWFGTDCDKQCQCLKKTKVCDKITGQCLGGCTSGKTGIDCEKTCPDGRYGVNCASQCGHCLDSAVCDKVTGICPRGCLSGWLPDLCSQACQDGSYGINCSSQCGNGDVCAKTTGTCPRGCASGWTSDTCLSSCPDGRYGANCASQCGHCLDSAVCDKVTGICPRGCLSGWLPDLCSQACQDGSYGINCSSQCGNCLNGDVCVKATGKCPRGCAPGWTTDTCLSSCQDGSYGINCSSQCGNCLNEDVCAKTRGTCPRGCAPGWTTDTCLSLFAATPGCLSREAPVVATVGTLLVLAAIALLTSIFYIRRLKRQLDALQKKPEDNYISLDENTRDPVVESIYDHIGNTSPYVNAGEVHQLRI